jgi:hypothetical protein
MGPQREDVAATRRRCRAKLGLKRTRLLHCRVAIEYYLIDLSSIESCNFNRRLFEDQFLKLELQSLEIPLSLFAQPIDSNSEQSSLNFIQVIDTDTGYVDQAERLCRLNSDPSIEDDVALVDKYGDAKTNCRD